MITRFTILLVGLILIGCKTNNEPVATDEVGQYFGEQIDGSKSINFDELMTKLESAEEVEATVTGKVEAVCQAKGCWMNIVSPTGNSDNALFVKFKDYGFFMPMDIAGKEVIMRGKAYKEETSVDELKHYAEDEGKSEEEIAAITEPITEIKFMADGVILKP